jgi:hypothetical protein
VQLELDCNENNNVLAVLPQQVKALSLSVIVGPSPVSAKERDSKVSRVKPKGGAWHRVKRLTSSDAEEVEAVAHLEITFESSYMSAESTGMVACTYHGNGFPIELGNFVHNS